MEKKDFIYGRIPIIEQLEAGKTFERILIQKGIDRGVTVKIMDLAKGLGVPYQMVPHFRMDRVTRRTHQGVIAFTTWVEYQDLSSVVQDCYERGEVPLVLVLDGITDVRNIGAIARSAEIFGVTAILLPMRESALLNADAVKTSAGAIMQIPLCRENSMPYAIRMLVKLGLNVCIANQKAKQELSDVDLVAPTAIIMGSEGKGVQSELLELATASFKIPQIGKTESLNVSVATGIVLYEVQSQRKQTS